MHSRLGLEPYDQSRIRTAGHVLLPIDVPPDRAEEAVGRWITKSVGVADRETLHERPVEAHLDLLRPAHPDDVIVDHPA